jgi:hypothetical protein
MIGYLRPKIIKLNDKDIIVRIRLNRRSRNHLNSMYFGALSVGADIAGGLHAFYHADQNKNNILLAFKSFQAQFLKRPESDVYFVCNEGEQVKQMLVDSTQAGERVNKPIHIHAYTNYLHEPEEVAQFTLELSVKVIQN